MRLSSLENWRCSTNTDTWISYNLDGQDGIFGVPGPFTAMVGCQSDKVWNEVWEQEYYWCVPGILWNQLCVTVEVLNLSVDHVLFEEDIACQC